MKTPPLLTKIIPALLLLIKLPLWLLLTGVIAHGIATLQTEHYQSGDTVNERFNVVVIDSYPKNLPELKKGDFRLQTTPDTDCMESCLRVNADGTFTYHNEGALWNSQSTYRIEDGNVMPVSFRFFTVVHIFYGMALATLGILFGNYVVRRFLYRHDKDKLQAYHQKIWHDLKWTVIVLGAMLVCYGVLELL
ncbi:MAG: hypothetical protein Q4C68_00255 [Moraxella sp.]|nr:hypothetical protein [Moraxella sp.]